MGLGPGVKRKHVHWTHVRTNDPEHRQPDQMTREEFWKHLEQVYRDVYPEPANSTGSILLFGGVAKELHAASSQEELRHEHHHAPTYSSKQHLWRKVAEVSLAKYHVKLHAACHEGYMTMYQYVRKASSKKPLAELDPEFYMSPEHPRGDPLRRLLESGEKCTRMQAGKWRGASSSGGGDPDPAGSEARASKRVRVSDIYDVVRQGGFRQP